MTNNKLHSATLDLIRQVEANIKLMKELNSRSCLSCVYWQQGQCAKWESLIPWEVIPEGCEAYSSNLELPPYL